MSRRVPARQGLAPRLGLLAALLAMSAAVQASSCQLACRKGSDCALTGPGATPLKQDNWSTLDNCKPLNVSAGQVELRYLHKGRWYAPPALLAGQQLDAVFRNYPPDNPCALPSRACLQTAMSSKQGAVGGHGIDARVPKPGGEGEPCRLGLPCGPVLPREGVLLVQLDDGGWQGSLRLQTARGSPPAGMSAEIGVPVQGGRASLDGRWLQAGGLYTYQLLDAGGQVRASGEFSVLASSMAERLRQRVAKRQADLSLGPEQAWYDTLMENLLLWDALQPLPGSTP